MSEKERIGFIGVGVLGAAMIERLLACGWPVSAWNRNPERTRLVEPFGARALPTPAAVAAASDVVMLCVLDGAAVGEVCFGPGGVADAGRGPHALIDFSTIDPDDARRHAGRMTAATGADWIDAPVSGGPPSAREGRLTVMAGGDAAAIARCRPLFDALSANFTRMGEVGAGQAAKVLNQAIVGSTYVLLAEVLALARRVGVDPALLPKALAGGLADGGALQRIYPAMAAEDFAKPLGFARQLDKDMANVRAIAEAAGLSLPVIAEAAARYHAYAAENPMADSASVSLLYGRGGEKRD